MKARIQHLVYQVRDLTGPQIRVRALTTLLWAVIAVGAVTGSLALHRVSGITAQIPEPSDSLIMAAVSGVGAIQRTAPDAALTEVVPLARGYWTVRASTPTGAVYSVAIAVTGGHAYQVGGVSRTAERDAAPLSPLVTELGPVPDAAADPIVTTVRTWTEAWLTGTDDGTRFAAPELGIEPLTVPYDSARVTHLGGIRRPGPPDAMLARAIVATTGPDDLLDVSLLIADRGDGTWQVAQLLPAPLTG